LLLVAQELERAEGRPPEEERRRWAPRVLDVDLLVVGDVVRDTPALTLPHPRLADRRFVLQPLADVNPDLHVPAPFDATVRELLDRCPDDADVVRTSMVLTEPA
jgi:2-amino-4-hydroxy-6-hydroxymethyldihydropteridine diphosphokinase